MSALFSLPAAALLMLAAAAPVAAQSGRPQPADPDADVPVLQYRSVFAEPAARSDRRIDWRQANDTVREVGGHAGTLRDSAAASAPAADRPHGYGSHHGHHGHQGRQP
jgi:hypothetical protein